VAERQPQSAMPLLTMLGTEGIKSNTVDQKNAKNKEKYIG